MAGDLPKSGVELAAENASAFFSTMDKSEKAVLGLERTTADAAGGVTKSGDIMTGVFQGVGQAAFDMAAQGAQAIGDFVADSVGKAGDFEAGMNNFAVAAGGALDSAGLKTEEFRDLFLELGQRLPVSTADVQDAATTLVKGGLDPMILKLGGLEDSLQFAAAAGLDLNQAAELSVKQLGTFVSATASAEEQTAFLAQSQDLLVKAAGASTLDVDRLADAMLASGAQAKLAGLDYDEFVTTMGLISPTFGSAAEAGTSFKNFLVRMQPSTKDAAAAMAELGLLTEDGKSKFYDAQGAFLGMENASQLLADATKDLSEAQRTQAFQTIFGNDAMGAAAALADSGAAGFDAFAKKMDKASGVQETAAGKQQGFNVALDNFMGSIEALQITIGSKLLPILTNLFNNVVSPAINKVTQLADAFEGGNKTFDSTLPVVQRVGEFMATVGAVAKELADKHLKRLTDAWERDLVPALAVAQEFFVNDLMPILEDLSLAVLPVLDATLDVLAATWENVLVPAIKVVWAFLDQVLIPVLKDVAAWLAIYLPPAVHVLADFFSNVLLPAVKPLFEFLEFQLIPTIKVLADFIIFVLGSAIQGWVLIFQHAFDAARQLADFFTGHFTWALSIVQGAFDGVGHAIDAAVGWIFRLGDAIRNIPPLPSDLIPGSPTPFEMGLRGIQSALKVTVPEISALSSAIGGLARVTPDASPSQIIGPTITNNVTNSRSISMPVYTNQSAAVVQQGMAIIQAVASGDI